jgi:hypothetical protein
MGWLFTYGQTRAQLIQRCLHGGASPSGYTPLDHAVVGTHLWVVFERTDIRSNPEDKTADPPASPRSAPERFIALYLLRSKRRYGWGYKAIDEGMGPVEVDCPLRLLDLAGTPQGEYSAAWRERVRAARTERSAKRARRKSLRIGETVTLAPGCQPAKVTITSLRPLRGRAENGCVYRIAPRHLVLP